jgi:hypothetical protein
MKEGEDVKKGGGDGMKEEIKKMNVAQLKEALKSYGLTVNRLKGDLRARLNTHLLELDVVGDDGEGKADTMEVDTIPGWGGGGDEASPLFSSLSGRGQRPVSSAAAASAVGKDDISGGGVGGGEGFSRPLFS